MFYECSGVSGVGCYLIDEICHTISGLCEKIKEALASQVTLGNSQKKNTKQNIHLFHLNIRV